MTVAYIGSQGHNLFLRSVTNQITQVVTNPNPASAAFVIREFSIVQRNAAGAITGVQNPWAEIDYKTSGGHDQYNAMQIAFTRRSRDGISANFQYTLGKSTGNTGGLERSGHRREQRAGHLGLRLRRRLQQVRRAPHLQCQPPVFDSVRQRPKVRSRRIGLRQRACSAAGNSAPS